MATKVVTVEVSTTLNLTMNGTSTVNGSFTWSAPQAPSGGTLQKIQLEGTWHWTGSQRVTKITIAGTDTTDRVSFTKQISTTPVTTQAITAVGGHKNCKGSSWTNDVKAVYYYEVEVHEAIWWKDGTTWHKATKVWQKNSTGWHEVTDLSQIDRTKNWVKGGS